MVKRIFDLALCTLSLPLVLPLFAGITLAILLDDGGPVLCTQMRLGQRRQSFLIYKFRNMHNGRVTRFGNLLRRTGLDETAQWINVLRGDISPSAGIPMHVHANDEIVASRAFVARTPLRRMIV